MHMKLRSCCADNFRQGISERAGAAMALQFTLSPPSSPGPAPLLPLLLTFMAVVIAAEAASPYPFLTEDAASAVDGKEYDYIVVGAGTAGCALAATLSEQYKVLLLERGGSMYDVPSTQSADRLFETLAAADASANGTSAAQAFVSEDGVDNVRGRVLGGSSALNFGFYSRASGAYITSMGWNQTLVTESYRWVETQLVSTYQKLKTWQRALYRAMIDADLGPDNGFTLDHVAGAKRSGSTFDAAGRRRSAAELLRRADPANIVVLLRATAARVVLRSGSFGAPPEVLGVELADKAGRRRVARIRGNDLACRARGSCSEVVLCAGALGSPQLLMLSGVGPAEHLRQLGIDVVVDLPAVGADVADPPRNNVTVVSKVALEFSMPQVVAIAGDESWYVESFSMQAPDGTSLAYVAEKVATPASRGRLRLRSRDPGENPAVRFNYFEDGVDVAACARAMRSIGDVLRTGGMETFVDRAAMGKVAENSLLPSDLSDEGGVQDFCRRTVRTMWHFHGGCGVGSVVNQQYQVIGGILNDNLRVVDASTHSASPGTNPQATTLMLGRYVGVQILRERERMGGAMSRRKHR